MKFRVLRLELDGRPDCGFEFEAPLLPDGRIDARAWRKAPEHCVVRRFWRREDDRHGTLVLTRSRRWTFRLAQDNDPQDDDSGWRENALRFTLGARLAITEQDGVARTYVVVRIDPA